MDFGSKHVYAYDLSDEESLSEGEMERGMLLSDNDDESAPPPPQLPPRSRRGPHLGGGEEGRGRRIRRAADTNVLCVKFGKLKHPSRMHTGDVVFCIACRAALSRLSRLSASDEGQTWVCEFCGNRNSVDVVAEEMPREEDITYMLESPLGAAAEGNAASEQPVGDSLVIFCVDVSGSMCVTTEVQGRFHLRGEERNRAQQLGEGGPFGFQAPNRNVTYVSRLQGVQAAIDKQLETLMKESPHQCVALVTFSNEVTVIGNGVPLVIAGDKLADRDELIKLGSEVSLPQGVGKLGKTLSEKVFSLEEGGATALGPALLFSITMASQRAGSKVIICTDGLANVGLGSLDELYTEEQQEEAQTFYDDLSRLAKDRGVTVSVVTIEGTECRMAELGQVADITGGQVNIVDPLKLTQEFGNMLANPIIATNVSATLILHSGLYFRYEETDESRLTREIGNVTADTEITFEFGVRTSKKRTPEPKSGEDPKENEAAAALPRVVVNDDDDGDGAGHKLSDLKELPFQLQIKYTSMDGAKSLRVISKAQPVTKDRRLAEKEMDIGVVGAHAAQNSARLAIEGHYSESRAASMVNQRMVQRWSRLTGNRDGYVNWFSNMAPMEEELRDAQQRERMTFGRSHSDDEFDEEVQVSAPLAAAGRAAPPLPPRSKKKKQARRKGRTDRSAAIVFNMKAARSTTFEADQASEADADRKEEEEEEEEEEE